MGLFRRLFGAKKSDGRSPSDKERRRWSFTRSSNYATPSVSNQRDALTSSYGDNLDANKHAIAVAAATAAVAEAALAAAQAAAEVVRLTSGSGKRPAPPPPFGGSHRRWLEEVAAVKIQSGFRGYLARRALRALKALVKLQALVRGHIVRKQTADMLRRMQTLVRLQARARATRTQSNSNFSRYARCGSNSNFREVVDLDESKVGVNWLDRWMEESLWTNRSHTQLRNQQADEEKSDKILEVDTWKPRMKNQQSNRTFQMTTQHVEASDRDNQSFMIFDSPSKLSAKGPPPNPLTGGVASGEILSSLNSLKLSQGKDEAIYRTAENSPHALSASSRPGSSSRRGPFTPTRSECSWGFFNGYSGYPNYMANTESSRAKVRSQSAPRQRLEFEKYGFSRSSYLQGFYDSDTISESGFAQHKDSGHNAYPPSGRLHRLGTSNLR